MKKLIILFVLFNSLIYGENLKCVDVEVINLKVEKLIIENEKKEIQIESLKDQISISTWIVG